jgi:hypothetical protein
MYKLFQSEPTAHQFFKVVGGKVIKATLVIKGTDISAADEYLADIALKALMSGSVTTPKASLDMDEATEEDLIAVKTQTPSLTHGVDALIKYLRAAKAAEAGTTPPLRVEISNAADFVKDTVVSVERGQDGKLTGATAHKV